MRENIIVCDRWELDKTPLAFKRSETFSLEGEYRRLRYVTVRSVCASFLFVSTHLIPNTRCISSRFVGELRKKRQNAFRESLRYWEKYGLTREKLFISSTEAPIIRVDVNEITFHSIVQCFLNKKLNGDGPVKANEKQLYGNNYFLFSRSVHSLIFIIF